MTLSFLVYDIIIRVYAVFIRIAAMVNPKARQWINGRRAWYPALKKALPEGGVDIWMHCASLGEFEQGRPLLEALRKAFPEKYILLTFFSPSGYEVRKNYAIVNHVGYLPLDTRKNAGRFAGLVKPRLAVFVKYEFWLHFITASHQRNIPVLLISAIFRPDQLFFQWYGKAFRRLLLYYEKIFVQEDASAALLRQAGITETTVAGDTRFDRVIQIAGQAGEIPAVDIFLQGKPAWVAGSTWPEDEQLIRSCYSLSPKWIIAPHEIQEGHLRQAEKLFPGKTIRYSLLSAAPEKYADKAVLLIDNVGMLSSLYRYGRAAYIGGGFGAGIHNILEAAVYGIPTAFGPRYHQFREAKDLIGLGAAFSVRNTRELGAAIKQLREENLRKEAGRQAGNYIRSHAGATEKITRFIQENRFLTN